MFSLELMHIAFHYYQSISQYLSQEITDSFRFHEVVCVCVEEIGEGANIRDEKAGCEEGRT